MVNNNKYFKGISIDKKTLGHQHLKSFDENKINVLSYRNGF